MNINLALCFGNLSASWTPFNDEAQISFLLFIYLFKHLLAFHNIFKESEKNPKMLILNHMDTRRLVLSLKALI